MSTKLLTSRISKYVLCVPLILVVLTELSTASTWPGGNLTSTSQQTVTVHNPCTSTLTKYTWTFTDTSGAKHNFGGYSWFQVFSQTPGDKPCPVAGQSTRGNLDEWSTDSQYYLSTDHGGITMIGGFVNPKFVVMGVTYAPPGPSSFVNYSNSAMVGTETDINNSFSSQYTNTVSVGAGIDGWGAKGTVTGTESTQYTQESDSSSSITVTQQTGRSDQTPGPANPYVGIDHDADIIWVWLNPLVRLAFVGDPTHGFTGVQQLGYGYSTDDPLLAMDVYPLYVGWLNGDVPIPANVQQVIARSWAAGQMWPSGQGPGLTGPGTLQGTDLYNILHSDPYWDCGTPQPMSCPSTVDGTRFTGPVSGENFVYQQAGVGDQPGTQTYNYTYTDTSVQGQGAKYTFQQTLSMEEVFGTKIFGVAVTATLTQESQFTWVHERNQKITNQTTSMAGLSITGAPCVVVSGACNPAYTGKTDFDVYQDNLYGSFLFIPVD